MPKKGYKQSPEHHKKIFESNRKSGVLFSSSYQPKVKRKYERKKDMILSERVRKSVKYIAWRKAVYERDDYTCQFCKKRGVRLEADHIIPFVAIIDKVRFEKGNDELEKKVMDCTLLWDTNNGRTLCKPCHTKTPTWGRCSRGISK